MPDESAAAQRRAEGRGAWPPPTPPSPKQAATLGLKNSTVSGTTTAAQLSAIAGNASRQPSQSM